jgi:osmoprotectant transport system ATP-binding protein
MADSPAVEFRNVSKVFGDTHAVADLTLQIPTGRVVALLGPSGCGKTTTLRLINRLEEPSAGQVLVRGQDVRSQRPEQLRRSIGYVIQEGGLFPHQSVAANVATVPRLLHWSADHILHRVREALDLVGLPEAQFGRRMPAQLSGGQRQRVGVARALAADPDMLLMDEPFGALDPGTREAIQNEFLAIHQRLKKTVVLVTHDIAEAGQLADQIVLLDRGQVLQEGTLTDLLLRPAGERVRAFLGRRAQELALEVLRLEQILPDLPAELPAADSVRLSAKLSLGQAMIALADIPEDATIVIDGEPGLSCRAKSLRACLVSTLEMAAGGRDGQSA